MLFFGGLSFLLYQSTMMPTSRLLSTTLLHLQTFCFSIDQMLLSITREIPELLYLNPRLKDPCRWIQFPIFLCFWEQFINPGNGAPREIH
mmetsp:Transcript_109077/g.315141  ORF Transcript_109077/g.315141 Transcript_109077/m.315141 type:complete len:90 (+) Transcript_109077:938-1207(+)